MVDCFEGQCCDRDKIHRRGISWRMLRGSQRVLDRQSHVRMTELGQETAIGEFGQRMDQALWMNQRVDLIEPDAEEMMCLNNLESLVDEGRRIYCDFAAHRPVRMAKRVLRRRFRQLLVGPASKRTTGSG